jgi:general secretion pathway protein F
MPFFKYKVANKSGKTFDFLIEGDNQQDSLRRLRARGFVPLETYGQVNDYVTNKKGLKFWKRKTFNAIEFTDRLVPLLKAHIQLERALGIIADGMTDKKQIEIVTDIRRGLHEGKKFSALVRSHGNCFPPIYANLVEAGEESGALVDVMAELHNFLNYKKEMNEFLITSSIYPAIILLVTFGVVILLFTVFIPRFSKIFFDMGKELPLPTAIMLWISEFITGFWWLWLICIAGISFVISRIRKGGKAKAWWDKKIVKLPFLGQLIQALEIGRFIKTLAVLLKNNVHLINSVKIASKVIQNTQIAKSFATVNTELKGGSKLSEALSKSVYMPKIVVQMLGIGEESGNMGDMLDQVANQQEKTMKLKIKRLLSLFEPAVILFLAVVVLTVVISIFLAILEMNEI